MVYHIPFIRRLLVGMVYVYIVPSYIYTTISHIGYMVYIEIFVLFFHSGDF